MLSQANVVKVLLAGCCLAGLFWSATGNAQDPRLSSEYYPLKVGNQWTYRAGDEKVIARVDKPVVLEMKKNAQDEKITAYRLVTTNMSHKDRQMTETIVVLPDGIYRYAGDDKDFTTPLCLFKLPPSKMGDTWPITIKVGDATVTGSFTASRAKVTVPLKTFDDAVLVSGKFQVGAKEMTVETWFASGTGIVKKTVKIGKDTTTLELEKFEEGK